MTFALGQEGGTQKEDNNTDKLRECDKDKGDGGQKSENFSGRHLSITS